MVEPLDDPFEDVLGQPLEYFRWKCPNCSFEHVSYCRKVDIEETQKRGALCPNCKAALYAPQRFIPE